MPDFGDRLGAAFESSGQLCLGIDPHGFLLDAWGLPDSASGAREFGLRAVESAAGVVSVVKPQVAFFERFGSAGFSALEATIAAARAASLIVLADAKRGDVGSTVAAYGEAWLTPGSPLEADAVTMLAYQGVGSLADPLALAAAHGKGIFILAATSNPESVATQTARRTREPFMGATVAAGIVGEVSAANSGAPALGNVGVVIGATVSMDDYGIDREALAKTPILAPGFGEQGAVLADVGRLYGSVMRNVIVNVGRSVLRDGNDGLPSRLRGLADELARATTR